MSRPSSSASLWDTFRSRRRVLAVGRTIASTTRVMDVLALLDDDPRIDLWSTIVPGSEFAHGVNDFFDGVGLPVLPWRQAVETRFDLAVAASANGDLHDLRGPLMLLPHGAGHNKHDPGDRRRLADLSDDRLVRNGEPVPSLLMLPGVDSMEQLRRFCPQVVPRARIAGDLTAQQLRSHRRLRSGYRTALGVSAGQRLVVVSSTWGPQSTLGQDVELLARLLAELPVDEYRVALIVHPNVAARHGDFNLRRRLRRALDAGLILIPSTAGWQATVCAADCVLGDSGSTTFYAADVAPVVISAHSPNEYPAGGPMEALIGLLPRLDVDAPLRPQVDDAMEGWKPDEVGAVLHRSIAYDEDAAARFHGALYELLELPALAKPEPVPLAVPVVDRRSPRSYVVGCTVVDGRVVVERRPAKSGLTVEHGHLVVATDEPSLRLWETAVVLVAGDDPGSLLDRFPACKAVTVDMPGGGCRIHTRLGDVYDFEGASSPVPLRDVAGSLWYRFHRDGTALPGELSVVVGGQWFAVSVSPS